MTEINNDNPITRIRDVLGLHLSGYLSGYSSDSIPELAVRVVKWPWQWADFPFVAVHQDIDFIDTSEEATVCTNVARFQIDLYVGQPTNEAGLELLDYWTAKMADPRALISCKDDPLWPDRVPPPMVERVRGARIYERIDGMLMAGASATVRAEYHIE